MTDAVSAKAKNLERTLQDLSDEAELADGRLSRAKADQLYLKRSIEPDDAIYIEKILKERGFEIYEDAEVVEIIKACEHPAKINYTTAIDQLITSARRVALLNPDEEAVYGESIQRAASLLEKPEELRTEIERRTIIAGRRAFDRLVHHNIRLVTSFVYHPSYRYRHDIDDMVQMGLFGLMEAAKKFDPAHGCRFSTYARWWIRQAIHRGIANDGKTIRLPVHMIALVGKYRRTRRLLGLIGGVSANSVADIAESLGWSIAFTARISQIAEMKTVSYDTPLGSEAEVKLEDIIEDNELDPEETIVAKDTAIHVRELIEGLNDERQRDIIRRRFGLDGPEETLETIGQGYGLTRERIRQIEAKALRKLRLSAEQRKLGPMRSDKT